MRQSAPRQAPAAPSERLLFIEGMRGVAALYVVLCHFCTMTDPRSFAGHASLAPVWLQNVMAPLWYGHLAVAAFIVISGFCLQMSLFDGKDGRVRSLFSFLKRRALRILPPYYACLGLSILVALTVTGSQEGMPFVQYLPVTWENVLAHLLLVHNLSPDWMYKINGVLWSISAEVQLYVIFPILVWISFKLGRWAVLLLGIAASYGILAVYPASVKLYPWYIGLFCLGIFAAHLAYRPAERVGPRPGIALLVAALGFGGCVFACIEMLSMPIRDAGIGLAVASVLYAGTVTPWARICSVFGWKPLVWIGAFSYSLYLMHHPIQQIVYVYRPVGIEGEAAGFLFLMGVGLPLIVVGCWLFAIAFEFPFVRRRAEDPQTRPGWIPVLPLRGARSHERRILIPAYVPSPDLRSEDQPQGAIELAEIAPGPTAR
jgi:peptidoglycan/LPS O-acetylase OafA/YrhL